MSFKFLTKKDFDYSRLEKVLAENPDGLETKENQDIYRQVLQEIQSGDFSLIGPQESYFLSSHQESVWISYLIHRWKFREYPKRKIIADFPFYVLIEPTSICNLRCVMCFQADKSFSSNHDYLGRMDVSFFKEIVDQAYEGGTKAITLASRGEPTLHPQLGEMLKHCTGKFYELKINTNATLLNETLIRQILDSDVTDIVFSIDSCTKEEYESIRKKGNFEKVLNNIIRVHEIREKYYPNSRTATRISGVQMSPQQNIEEFHKFWEKICDHVVIKSCFVRWDTYNNPVIPGNLPPCSEFWTRMYIWYDGTCNPCDTDYKSELSVGSARSDNLRSIWHGSKYIELREKHLKSQRNQCFPCNRCAHDVPDNLISEAFKAETNLEI